jgi:hypothetical protein
MWIFSSPAVTVKPSTPTTTGDTPIAGLHQVSASLIDDAQGKITEAQKWKDDLLGTPTKPVAPPDTGFAQKMKDLAASLAAGDRTALAGASTRTATRLRSGAAKKVQEVVPTIFFSEATTASVPARKATSDLIDKFYAEHSWKPGDSLDDADRRSTLAKLFDDLAQALKP